MTDALSRAETSPSEPGRPSRRATVFKYAGWTSFLVQYLVEQLMRFGPPTSGGAIGAYLAAAIVYVVFPGLFLVWGPTRRLFWGWGALLCVRLSISGG